MKRIIVMALAAGAMYFGYLIYQNPYMLTGQVRCPACEGTGKLVPGCADKGPSAAPNSLRDQYCTTPKRCQFCEGSGRVDKEIADEIPRAKRLVTVNDVRAAIIH